MNELSIARFFLDISFLLGMTYLTSIIFSRIHLPSLFSALFVAISVHYTPIGKELLSNSFYPTLTILADLGALFLLFFVGLQIDFNKMKRSGQDIALLTFLNTIMPFLLAMCVMLLLGYRLELAAIVGLTQMPTAEAIIVPILDEFNIIKTRVGKFIIGAGILDDVIEVFLVAFVSIWIATKASSVHTLIESSIIKIVFAIVILIVTAIVSRQFLVPILNKLLPSRTRHLLLLSIIVLLGFGGFSTHADLGFVLGAIIAGCVMHPTIKKMGETGKQTTFIIKQISYGFFGLLFFFWVGLNIDMKSLINAPMLALVIYLAGTIGKFIGTFAMVPFGKFNLMEATIIGTGLNARFTTEIIVAKLLFDSKLISSHLFTSLVAASSLSTLTVPIVLTLLLTSTPTTFRNKVLRK